MSYQNDRDQFIARTTTEGLPFHVAQALLRTATGINRRAELACSSEASIGVPARESGIRW